MSMFRALLLAGLSASALAAPVSAQSYATDQGSFVLGGSAGFSSTGHSSDGVSADERITSLHASPTVQYFVRPGLSLGGSVVLSRQSQGESSLATVGAGPTVSYFFGGPDRSVYPFVSADALYLNTESEGSSSSNLGYRGSVGALVMLSRSVGLNASLYYQEQGTDGDDFEFDTDTYGLAVGFSAFTF